MKKLTAFILAAVLILALTACGEKEPQLSVTESVNADGEKVITVPSAMSYNICSGEANIKYLESKENVEEATLSIKIEVTNNGTGQIAVSKYSAILVNGEAANIKLYKNVEAGATDIIDITLSTVTYPLSTLETVEFKLHVFSTVSYFNVVDTDIIVIDF